MSNDFYSDDLNAQAAAENSQDPMDLQEKQDLPVTSGEMQIGDLDNDGELKGGSSESYDEEAVPGSDNV